jgi:hypothetical protein
VLLASVYFAGGGLAGVFIAFFAGVCKERSDLVEHWSRTHNPFFAGPWADVLSLLPFLVLMILLYLVGREKLLAPKAR